MTKAEKIDQEKNEPAKGDIGHLKLVAPLVKPYKKHIILALVLLALGAAANLAIPAAFKQMIDLGFSAENKDTLSNYFIVVLVVSSLMILFTSLRYYWVSWIGQKVVTDLRKKVYAQVMKQSAHFFESTKTGEILSRINTDTTLVETVVGSTFSIALRSAVTFLGAAIMMVVSSPKLAGLIALMIPLVIIPIAVVGKKIQKLSKVEQDRIADSSAMATETINAIHTVQAYAQEGRENTAFQGAINKAFKASVDSIRMTTTMSILVGFVIFGGIISVLWLGATDVINGTMTAGTLSQFVMYAIMVATSTGALTTVWSELKKAAGALERIIELMNTESDIIDSPDAKALSIPIIGNVTLKHVNFAYPSRPDLNILTDINLEVPAGKTIALVGPSGAGKSTLFQLLMRFYEPQQGEVMIDGQNIKNFVLADLRKQFSLVAQNVTIFSNSAADNIAYGEPDATQEQIQKAASLAHADEFIQGLDKKYDTYLGERGVRLSGGQAQRLSIARAVVTEPPVLLLDEATSALDAESERLVQDALNRIMKNRTTLVIAHRLATIRQADSIVVMDKGQIVAQGTHDDLVNSSPLYAKLAKLQFTEKE